MWQTLGDSHETLTLPSFIALPQVALASGTSGGDADGDGYSVRSGDCNDSNRSICALEVGDEDPQFANNYGAYWNCANNAESWEDLGGAPTGTPSVNTASLICNVNGTMQRCSP